MASATLAQSMQTSQLHTDMYTHSSTTQGTGRDEYAHRQSKQQTVIRNKLNECVTFGAADLSSLNGRISETEAA